MPTLAEVAREAAPLLRVLLDQHQAKVASEVAAPALAATSDRDAEDAA